MNNQETDTRRKIAVVITSRADYGHLYWTLKELKSRLQINLQLIALGAHFSPEFGNTFKEIEADGFRIDERIECLFSSDSDVGMAKTIGLATLGLATLGLADAIRLSAKCGNAESAAGDILRRFVFSLFIKNLSDSKRAIFRLPKTRLNESSRCRFLI